jgi:hypothetical protein
MSLQSTALDTSTLPTDNHTTPHRQRNTVRLSCWLQMQIMLSRLSTFTGSTFLRHALVPETPLSWTTLAWCRCLATKLKRKFLRNKQPLTPSAECNCLYVPRNERRREQPLLISSYALLLWGGEKKNPTWPTMRSALTITNLALNICDLHWQSQT